LVNNILGETNDADIAAGNSDNIEFFLNDEESDGTDDDLSDNDEGSDENEGAGSKSQGKIVDKKSEQ
ncbi:hypothetical protein LPJ75_004477, partial [Coemansia sp. RSA 2598]